MRTTPLIIFTAALLAASPALAQNEAAPTNADTNAAEANAVAGNEVMPAPENATEPMAVPADNAAMPETAPAPEPKKRSFPWGVIGLLGLLGLIPRTRR
jgi:hypothetical protein